MRRAAKIIGTTAVTLATLYAMDVSHGIGASAQSHSEVIHILDNPAAAHADEATVVSAGWGSLDSARTAASLPAYSQEGSIWALRYDNNGVDTTSLAQKLIADAKANNINKLSFSGHSMGGLIDLDIARKIYESNTNLTIPYIVLDCTPSSIDAVWGPVRDEGNLMAEGISYVPGARWSSSLRLIAEEAARYNQFRDDSQILHVDIPKFLNTTKTVLNEKILTSDVASASLLDSQFQLIVANDAQSDLLALGKDNGKQKPVIIFIRPADATADPTVDDIYAENQFKTYTRDAHLPYVVVKVPGIGHASANNNPTEYNTALTDAVFPVITKQENGYTLPRATYLSESGTNGSPYKVAGTN
jgi:pimeloyl-ACP methyl ester carboxylesterase